MGSRLLASLLVVGTVAAGSAMAARTDALPDRLAPLGPQLALAGCGAARVMWFEVYRIGLYVPPGLPRSQALSSPEVAKALRVVIVYQSGLPEDPPPEYRTRLERLDPRHVSAFRELWRRLGPGDVITVAYRPGEGTVLALGDRPLATDAGHGLMTGLLNLWVGPDPVSTRLRGEILDGSCGRAYDAQEAQAAR